MPFLNFPNAGGPPDRLNAAGGAGAARDCARRQRLAQARRAATSATRNSDDPRRAEEAHENEAKLKREIESIGDDRRKFNQQLIDTAARVTTSRSVSPRRRSA